MSIEDLAGRMQQKKADGPSLARKDFKTPKNIAKIVRRAAALADLITPDDREANAKVLREAKAATHRIFDVGSKTLIEVPDHKTRLAAITLELAYTEGTPVQRSVTVTGTVEDLGAVLGRMSESPEAKRMLQAIDVDSLPSGQNVASDEGATREEP